MELTESYRKLTEIVAQLAEPDRFDDASVPKEFLEAIVKLSNAHVSINNLRPIEFVVLTGEKVREVVEASMLASRPPGIRLPTDQVIFERIRNAAHPLMVIVLVDSRFKSALPESVNRQESMDMIAGACIQNTQLAVASLGLSSSWRPVRTSERESLRKLLNIPEHMEIKAVVEVGFALTKKAQHYVREVSQVLHQTRYESEKAMSDDDIRRFIIARTRGFWKL